MAEPAVTATPPDGASPRPVHGLHGLVPALLGLWFFVALGQAPLFDVDEGAFAEASREMLTSGDFGHTTLNGADRFDKPVGVYWLQALSIAIFGASEWAVRLPSAVCSWLLCMVAWRGVRARWGEQAGVWVALILATSIGPWVIGRAATADALLNLLLMLTALDLWRHLHSAESSPLRRAALWMAMGTLTKGPVAVLVPGGAVLLWLLVHRDLQRARQMLGDPVAWVVLLGVSVPWYLYAWWRHGTAFVEGFLVRHNLERFNGPLEGHAGPWWTYLVVLPLLCLPWTALLVAVVWRVRRIWQDPESRLAVLWVGFVLVFFSISGTKLPHYVLYAMGPLAWLMAREAARAGTVLQGGVWAGLFLWLAAAGLLPVFGPLLALQAGDPLIRALAGYAPAPGQAVGWILAAGVVLAAGLAWTRVHFSWRAAVGASAVTMAATLHTWLWVGEALQGPVRRAALASREFPGRVTQWNGHWPSVGYYREQPVPKGVPLSGELAFIRKDRLDPSIPAEVLWEERGVALVRRK